MQLTGGSEFVTFSKRCDSAHAQFKNFEDSRVSFVRNSKFYFINNHILVYFYFKNRDVSFFGGFFQIKYVKTIDSYFLKNNLNLCKLFISEFKRGEGTIQEKLYTKRVWIYSIYNHLNWQKMQYSSNVVETKYSGLSQVKVSNPSKCTLWFS